MRTILLSILPVLCFLASPPSVANKVRVQMEEFNSASGLQVEVQKNYYGVRGNTANPDYFWRSNEHDHFQLTVNQSGDLTIRARMEWVGGRARAAVRSAERVGADPTNFADKECQISAAQMRTIGLTADSLVRILSSRNLDLRLRCSTRRGSRDAAILDLFVEWLEAPSEAKPLLNIWDVSTNGQPLRLRRMSLIQFAQLRVVSPGSSFSNPLGSPRASITIDTDGRSAAEYHTCLMENPTEASRAALSQWLLSGASRTLLTCRGVLATDELPYAPSYGTSYTVARELVFQQ